MPKFRSHLDTPSNQALQIYLDDLTMSESVFSSEPYTDGQLTQVEQKPQSLSDKPLGELSGNQINHMGKKDSVEPRTSNIEKDVQNMAHIDGQASESQKVVHQTHVHSPNTAQSSQALAGDEKLNNAKQLLARANAISNILLNNPSSLIAEQALGLADGLLYEADLLNKVDSQETSSESKEISKDADNHTKRQIRDENYSLCESLPNRFQVLLCDLGEQTIAIPLVELGGIIKVERFTQRSSKRSWFYGLYVKGEQTFTCIDSANYLSGAKHLATDEDRFSDCEYKYLVQLGKSEFALCCRGVASTLEVAKQDVKWRQNVTKQPWFAGILKEPMHALIDGAEMVRDVLKLSGAT